MSRSCTLCCYLILLLLLSGTSSLRLPPITMKGTPGRYSTRLAAKKAKENTPFRVTSYNVLSSHLSAPNYFRACSPEFLDPNYRYKQLENKLHHEVDSEAIVCLQEVSQSWAGRLHTFFSKHDYHLITGLYGNKFNGYMGISVAVPLKKFEINSVDITRVSDTKRMPYKPKITGFFPTLMKTIKTFLLNLAIYFKLYQPPIDNWDNALYRSNQMICTRLTCKDSGKTFVVGNYHMPCMFKLPSVMVTHCALSAQHIHRYANGDPYVYVGDFNIKPQTSQYDLLTKGNLEKSHPDYPHPPEGDEWSPAITPLRSAYVEKNGSEPNFTNFAKVQDDPIFCETLDYIFLSKDWEVQEVEELPHRDTVQGPLPNQDEPSDHVLISATLSLPHQVDSE